MIVNLGAFLANLAFPALASLFWLWSILSYLRVRRGYGRYWRLLPVLCVSLALSNMALSLSIAPATRLAMEIGRAYSRLALFGAALTLTVFTVYYLREAFDETKE